MNSKEVVIDTNFFMVPFQFNVDIITELENKLPSYTLTTPSFVINELKGFYSKLCYQWIEGFKK